jgi:hypothetical protein
MRSSTRLLSCQLTTIIVGPPTSPVTALTMGYQLERTALGTRSRRKRSSWARTAMLLGLVVCSVGLAAHTALVVFGVPMRSSLPIPKNAKELRDRCDALKRMPGPPAGFHARARSERFEVGTSATLITNATIFTGSSQHLLISLTTL